MTVLTHVTRTGTESDIDLAIPLPPRVFAIVYHGPDVDPWMAAWGLVLPDRIEVINIEGGPRMSLSSLDLVMRMYDIEDDASPRLIWVPTE